MDIITLIKNLLLRLIYGNDVELLYHPNRRAQSMLTMEAVLGGSGLVFMQGTFQQGFLIQQGASDQILAYLPVMGSIAGFAALFGGLVFDRRQRRKHIIVTMLLIARLLLSAIVYVPVLVPKELCVPVIVAMIIVASILSSIADVGYNSWLMALVPPEIRGRFMAVRSTITHIILPFLPLVAAFFLDNMRDKNLAFMLLFGLGGILIIAEAAVMSRVKEPEYLIPEGKRMGLLKMFKVLRENKSFFGFMLYIMTFYFFLYICGSFTSAYMLKYNNLSYTLVSVATTGCTVIMMLLYRSWGKWCDRAGSGKVLYFAQLVFAFEMFTWVVIPPHLLQYLLFIPFIFQAVSNSSSNISMYTRKYEFIPEENRNLYTGIMTASMALPLLLGPFLGNKIKDALEAYGPQWVTDGMWQFRFLYLTGGVLILLQKLYTYIKKKKFEV